MSESIYVDVKMKDFLTWTCPSCHNWSKVEIAEDAKFEQSEAFNKRWLEPALDVIKARAQEHVCKGAA